MVTGPVEITEILVSQLILSNRWINEPPCCFRAAAGVGLDTVFCEPYLPVEEAKAPVTKTGPIICTLCVDR